MRNNALFRNNRTRRSAKLYHNKNALFKNKKNSSQFKNRNALISLASSKQETMDLNLALSIMLKYKTLDYLINLKIDQQSFQKRRIF